MRVINRVKQTVDSFWLRMNLANVPLPMRLLVLAAYPFFNGWLRAQVVWWKLKIWKIRVVGPGILGPGSLGIKFCWLYLKHDWLLHRMKRLKAWRGGAQNGAPTWNYHKVFGTPM